MSTPSESISGNAEPGLHTLLESLEYEKNAIFDISPGVQQTDTPDYGSMGLNGMQPIDTHRRRQLDDLYARTQRTLAKRAMVSPDEHSTQTQLDYVLDSRRELLLNTDYLWPVDSSSRSTPIAFLRDAQGVGRHTFDTTDSYEAFVHQAAGFSGWVRQAIENMNRGIQEGDTLSQYSVERALGRLAACLDNNGQAVRDAVAQPLSSGVLLDTARDRYEAEVTNSLLTGIDELHTYMRDTYAQACRTDDMLGMYHVPDGKEQYERFLRYHLCDDVSPDEIYAVAETQYNAYVRELAKLALDIGTTPEEIYDSIRHPEKYPQQLYANEDEIVEACADLERTVELERVFFDGDIPRQACILNIIKGPAAQGIAPMYDNNVFSLPVGSPHYYRPEELRDVYIHEAIGHHVGVHNGAAHKPPFLRDVSYRYSAVREGWAQYMEGLAGDLGLDEFDKDAQARLCAKAMNTPAFMMTDINVNYRGHSLEQARAFIRDKLPGSKFEEKGNMARLLAWPAQAHSYVYGEQMFKALRREEEMRLGAAFDPKEFHHNILVSGETTFSQIRQRLRQRKQIR